MNQEILLPLIGSLRCGVAVSPLEHVDIVIDSFHAAQHDVDKADVRFSAMLRKIEAAVYRHDISKANARFTEMLENLQSIGRAVRRGADLRWVDAATGAVFLAEVKSCNKKHPTLILASSYEDAMAQARYRERNAPLRDEVAGPCMVVGSGKSAAMLDLLLQVTGEINLRQRTDPAESLEALRRLIRIIRKAKRIVARLLSQLSFHPFLAKMIAVRLLGMHRGEDDPDSLLYLRRHLWTAGRSVAV